MKNPLLKTTLRQAEGEFFEDKISITVESDFALEQLKKSENQQELEKVVEEITGRKMALELQKGKVRLRSVTQEIKPNDIRKIFI